MLSVTQKALLYNNIPTDLGGLTVTKYLKDRFEGPTNYPSLVVSFLTEGVKKHWTTWAPIENVQNADTLEYDEYFGEQDEASISLTLWSETEEELRAMADDLEIILKLAKLDFYWPDDHMKVSNVKGVQLLSQYPDEFNQVHSYRAVIDFNIEYEWKDLELAPAIRSFEYLFSSGTISNNDVLYNDTLYSYMMGSYGMLLSIKGIGISYSADYLIHMQFNKYHNMRMYLRDRETKSFSCDMILRSS